MVTKNKLYQDGLEFSDLLRDAHPEGSVQIINDKEGLVEDAFEAQLKTINMVAKQPTLAALASLSDYLDDNSFHKESLEIDQVIKDVFAEFNVLASLARVPIVKTADVAEEYDLDFIDPYERAKQTGQPYDVEDRGRESVFKGPETVFDFRKEDDVDNVFQRAKEKRRPRPSSVVTFVQKFLTDRRYPVRSDPSKMYQPDGFFGRTTNNSLISFIRDARTESDVALAERIKPSVSNNHKETDIRAVANAISSPLPQEKNRGSGKLEKPEELYRIDFEVNGRNIKNFPITYILGKLKGGSAKSIEEATIYMVEFLKAYGALPAQSYGKINWESLPQPFTKVVESVSKVLDEKGYGRLQNYLAPMERYVQEQAIKAKTKANEPKQEKKSINILELLDGIYPAGHEYHKLRNNPVAEQRLLKHLATDLKFSTIDGTLIVSEGRVRGSLARIEDYVKSAMLSKNL